MTQLLAKLVKKHGVSRFSGKRAVGAIVRGNERVEEAAGLAKRAHLMAE